jgi:hypothetical protein
VGLRLHQPTKVLARLRVGLVLLSLPATGLVIGRSPSSTHATTASFLGRNGTTATPACRDGAIAKVPSPGTYGRLDALAVDGKDIWAVGTYVNPKSKVVQHRTLAEIWAGKKWTVSPTPDPAQSDVLYGVTAISPDDVWAVGYTANRRQLDTHSLIEHFDGAKWTAIASPGTGLLDSAASTSATDVWAVGISGSNPDGKGKALIEHWNGNAWEKIPAPDPGAWADGLASVTALSADDAWAVGLQEPTENTERTLVEHWDGTSWEVIPTPNAGIASGLSSVGFAGSTDAWAVGWYEQPSPEGTLDLTLTEHWNGTKWSITKSPSPTGDDTLNSEAVISPADVWAAGSSAENAPFVIHWNGSDWSQLPATHEKGAAALLFAVAATSADSVWTVGLSINSHNYTEQTFSEYLCP